jgi:tetrahydromethanopterin S-methyltransferase subunit G
VTKSVDTPRCGWCHRPLPVLAGAGRPRRFCSPSHRQRAYEARRRADSLHVPDGQVIVSAEDLRRLHDRLYLLESAVQDVDADLAGNPGPKAYRAAFDHLYEAAKDLVGTVVEAVRQ